ncbi:unnamed protein product, partial [Symbiodinium sp. CCMP2456]
AYTRSFCTTSVPSSSSAIALCQVTSMDGDVIRAIEGLLEEGEVAGAEALIEDADASWETQEVESNLPESRVLPLSATAMWCTPLQRCSWISRSQEPRCPWCSFDQC